MAVLDILRPATPIHAIGAKILGVPSALNARYVAWRSAEATYRELSSLSDAELNDIGLCRGDIAAVAAGTYR